MKSFAIYLGLTLIATSAQAAASSFAPIQFGDVAQIALPRNWTYLDNEVANHLNTSAEAVGHIAGIYIDQGDNKILVAANAFDSAGKTKATLRLSVRGGKTANQLEIRELSKQSPQLVREAAQPEAQDIANSMLRVPSVQTYKVLDVRIDTNGALYCTRFTFEGFYGGRDMLVDTWVCPLGNRTIKLSTSYEKRHQSIYRPTIEYIWRSLSAK